MLNETMTNAQKIRQAITYKRTSAAKIAKTLGITSQAFSQRLKTDKFSSEELKQIAHILGGEYVFGFEFPDGTKI